MGAFNTVETASACTRCGKTATVQVQFKYGDVWQHAYASGDELRWGGNDVGRPGAHTVVADGVAERLCSDCGLREDVDFYVWITDGRISAVEVADGRFSFSPTGHRYLVLDE